MSLYISKIWNIQKLLRIFSGFQTFNIPKYFWIFWSIGRNIRDRPLHQQRFLQAMELHLHPGLVAGLDLVLRFFFSPPLKIKRSWGWPKVLWKTRRTRKHGRGGGVTQNGRTNHAFWHLKDYCVSWSLSLSNYQYLVVLSSKYVIVLFLKDGWWGGKKEKNIDLRLSCECSALF